MFRKSLYIDKINTFPNRFIFYLFLKNNVICQKIIDCDAVLLFFVKSTNVPFLLVIFKIAHLLCDYAEEQCGIEWCSAFRRRCTESLARNIISEITRVRKPVAGSLSHFSVK